MNIRPARAADLPELAAIDAAGNPSPWQERQFAAALQHPADTLLVCETEGRITGFIVWQQILDESELHLIAVSPEHRRQGIALSLLEHWFQTAERCRLSRLLLEVRAGNEAAAALYRRCGFSVTGRRKNYYPRPNGGFEDALLMEKPC